MIPKIIHLCWLSGDPFPPEIENCINSWKVHLSDYEIWLWGKCPKDFKNNYYIYFRCIREINFDVDSTEWTKEACQNKKYAFAADYIRLWALYKYGGIYLDSDIMVYKSFNNLLHQPYFIGQDNFNCFEPAAFGAEKNCKWIEELLEHYNNRHFVTSDGHLDMVPLPHIFYNILSSKYMFIKVRNNAMIYNLNDGFIYVYPSDFFNSRNILEVAPSANSYCSHNYAGSWTVKNKSLKYRVLNLIPKRFMMIYYCISHRLWNRPPCQVVFHNI